MIVYSGAIDDSRELIQFFRREAANLTHLRKVIISREKTLVLDVNNEGLEFPGLTYGSTVLETLLRELRVVFTPAKLHDADATPSGVKEYRLTARYAWGEDRVM